MYIIDYDPKMMDRIDDTLLSVIEEKIINKQNISNLEIEYLLTYLSYISRKMVGRSLNDACINKCDTVQSMIVSYLTRLGVTTHPCATQNVITNGIVGHSFLTAEFTCDNKNKTYLIDPTYQQFLLKENCNDSKFFHHQGITLLKPDPGYYIKPEDYELLTNFVNNGFSELTDEIAKMYGDSFYNTKQGTLERDKSFKTISGNIYINSFNKGNEKLSKNDETLKEEELFIELKSSEKDKSKSL